MPPEPPAQSEPRDERPRAGLSHPGVRRPLLVDGELLQRYIREMSSNLLMQHSITELIPSSSVLPLEAFSDSRGRPRWDCQTAGSMPGPLARPPRRILLLLFKYAHINEH